ncbi:MAG TPA: outer membrane protein assembly factor BamD [Rubrivivax sp.]|jgi:outer membrane protein assembly factor BamD|nr:outer membrane protein assembly factor BamD [Rubrivivax sp.]
MTVSQLWRLARVPLWALLASTFLQFAGCSSTPKDESAANTAERLYKEARGDMEAGSYDRAIKSLERVEGLAAGSLLAQQALLDMAYLNWKSGERTTALSTVDRFIKLNPSSAAYDYALYLRGVINFNENLGLLGNLAGQDISERDQASSRESFQSFKQLVDQFPNSRYAPDARLRMNHIVNSLASYEVHVARYYFRRGAYLAAATRAQQALTEFQQSPAVEEALYLLVQSYDKLQLTQLRDDADRVLRQNFPNSAFLTQGLAARDKRPWWKFW